jgi:hypothetical protein
MTDTQHEVASPAAVQATGERRPVTPAGTAAWRAAVERRLGRGRWLCLALGISLILLMAVPVACCKRWAGNYRWLWRLPAFMGWRMHQPFPGVRDALLPWALALLPALGGGLAILAGLLRGLGRGMFAWAAGAVLLFAGPVLVVRPLLAKVVLGMPGEGVHAVEVLAGPPAVGPFMVIGMAATALAASVLGGHRAAAVARGHPLNRLAALIPSLLSVLPLLFMTLVIATVWTRGGQGGVDFGVLSRAVPKGRVIGPPLLLGAAAALLMSALVGLVNARGGNPGVARIGFVLGGVGFALLAVVASLSLAFYGTPRGEGIYDRMHGAGLILHTMMPFIGGVVLLVGGYARMWLWALARCAAMPKHSPLCGDTRREALPRSEPRPSRAGRTRPG